MITAYRNSGNRNPSPITTHYSPEETIRLQEIFRPTAAKHRHHQRIAFIALGLALATMAFSLLANGLSQFVLDKPLFGKNLPWPVTALMVLAFAVFAWAKFTSPRLRCPGCTSFMDKGIGRHCPECGSERLTSDFFGRPHCEACGQTMKRTKHGHRRFTIRNCTTCGLTVDSQGL